MNQEEKSQLPALKEVLALDVEESEPQLQKLKISDTYQHFEYIPVNWFKRPIDRDKILEKFAGKATRLVFDSKPTIRKIMETKTVKIPQYDPFGEPIADKMETIVEEVGQSALQVIVWTALGGWSVASTPQKFDAPDWNTKFIHL